MKKLFLLFCLTISINVSAQISPYTEIKAGLTLPNSSEYLSTTNQNGYSLGIDLGLNLDETKSFGFSFDYIKNGYSNEIQLKNILNKSNSTQTIKGNNSSIISIGLVTRAENTTLINFIHPYAKLFFGYSYVKIAGFGNENLSYVKLSEVNENNFTVTFSLGLLFPISEYFSGFGIEGNYNIFMKEQDYKEVFSMRLIYRYNIVL